MNEKLVFSFLMLQFEYDTTLRYAEKLDFQCIEINTVSSGLTAFSIYDNYYTNCSQEAENEFFHVDVLSPLRSFSFISYVYLKSGKREIILLFYFACRPVVVRIISATKLVNLVSLRLDFFYVRVQISIIHILFERDPFFLGQMYFQKVQLRATYEPRNSIILDRGFTHSFVARWPRKYAS